MHRNTAGEPHAAHRMDQPQGRAILGRTALSSRFRSRTFREERIRGVYQRPITGTGGILHAPAVEPSRLVEAVAKAEANSLGISVAEFVRRAVREALPSRGDAPWIKFAGFVETGNPRSDRFHALFRRLFSAPPPLSPSSLVVAEGHGWILRRYDQNRAIQFLAFIDVLPGLTIRNFETPELAKTGRIVKKFADQNRTLADAHGLAIMRELRIGWCWSTDRPLGLDGVPLVI